MRDLPTATFDFTLLFSFSFFSTFLSIRLSSFSVLRQASVLCFFSFLFSFLPFSSQTHKKIKKQTFLSLFFTASISSFFLSFFLSSFSPFSSQAHKKKKNIYIYIKYKIQETNFSFFVLRCKHRCFLSFCLSHLRPIKKKF